jgi:uncharacterized NAD(P)/FAD-binding protein YdhS
VYCTTQAETNWINITESILTLDKRPDINNNIVSIPSFPSYYDWANLDALSLQKNRDHYLPRSKVGHYLHQRCKSLISLLVEAKIIKLIREKVLLIVQTDNEKLEI